MGIKFSRKRDTCDNSAEAAEEPTSAQPEDAENQPETTGEPDADDKQHLDVVVMKPASPVASLPKEDCTWESKEVKEAESQGTAAPADPSVPEADPAPGAQACTPEPETIIKPAGLRVDPEPASEAQGHKGTVTVKTIPNPVMPSPTLDELGDPALDLHPNPGSVNPDDESHDKLMELELGRSSQEVRNDMDKGGVDKLLESLELTGSDLNADIIPADTDTCDDTPAVHT